MTDTQHAQSLEEEVVSNDPVTDQEPAPDAPYGHLPRVTAGVNPWRVQPEVTVPEGRRGRGFLLPRMATPAGLIEHRIDWALPAATGALKLQGENPRSFTFLNYSSLTAFGFFDARARQPGQQRWFVPPYCGLTLGVSGPIAWIFDPNGFQSAPATPSVDQMYIVQAYDLLLAPGLRQLGPPPAHSVAVPAEANDLQLVTGSGILLGADVPGSNSGLSELYDGTSASAPLVLRWETNTTLAQPVVPPGGIRFSTGLYFASGATVTQGAIWVA